MECSVQYFVEYQSTRSSGFVDTGILPIVSFGLGPYLSISPAVSFHDCSALVSGVALVRAPETPCYAGMRGTVITRKREGLCRRIQQTNQRTWKIRKDVLFATRQRFLGEHRADPSPCRIAAIFLVPRQRRYGIYLRLVDEGHVLNQPFLPRYADRRYVSLLYWRVRVVLESVVPHNSSRFLVFFFFCSN